MNILTVGGATQDIFLQYEGTDFMTIAKKNMVANYMLFESGEKKELATVTYDTGGGATNAAVSFARLGFATSCFCNIGNDAAGQAVRATLIQEGVSPKYLQVDSTMGTGQSFIVNSQQGESTIFAYRGANRHLPADKIPADYLATCNYLYITSLSHEAAAILPQLTSLAKKHRVPVATNPGISQLAKGTKILKESLKDIDVLILNSAEAQIFMHALIQGDENYKKTLIWCTNDQPTGINQPYDHAYLLCNPLIYEDRLFSIKCFFQEVLKMGPKIVVVTNGCNGVYVASDNHIIFCPSMKIKVTNTVGGGDAFGSCFVASLALGYTIEDALQNGILNSASVLQHCGAKAGLLSRQQLEQQRKHLDKNVLQRCPLM
jgi:sugar/nucleoside kinase (ribokinase family)